MDKKEFKTLLDSHILTDDEEFVNEYKSNPPQVAEKLQWQPGEAIISELSKKDLIQLLSRYLNNEGTYIKNILHFLLRIERMLTWELEAKGIDVNKKFKEDAKKKAEQMELNLAQAKAELENLSKKN